MVKWLIADQIAGNPELNFDPGKRSREKSVAALGTVSGADGVKPRSDGLTYRAADFVEWLAAR